MDIRCDRDTLAALLDKADRCAGRDRPCMLRASAGRVVVEATDLDMSISAWADADVDDADDCAAPARALRDAVRAAPGEVRLRLDGSALELSSGRYRSKMAVATLDGVYMVAPAPEDGWLPVDDALLRACKRASYCLATDASRPNLCGLGISTHGGVSYATATDGHRLASVPLPSVLPTCILPPRLVADLGRLVSGPLEVRIDDTMIHVRSERATVSARLIDGVYPDWRRVVPKAPGPGVVVASEALLAALARVGQSADAKSFLTILAVVADQLTMRASDAVRGRVGEDSIDCDGELPRVGVSSAYLRQAVEAVASRDVRISCRDELAPILVAGVGVEGETHVVMPCREAGEVT